MLVVSYSDFSANMNKYLPTASGILPSDIDIEKEKKRGNIKGMRILVDTNICLDILQKRPEFYDNSKTAVFLASKLYSLIVQKLIL